MPLAPLASAAGGGLPPCCAAESNIIATAAPRWDSSQSQHDRHMGRKQTSMLSISKRIGAVVGCAVVAPDGGAVSLGMTPPYNVRVSQADSGRGSGGGIYTQPGGGMETGATQTWSGLAATTPEFPKARPPL